MVQQRRPRPRTDEKNAGELLVDPVNVRLLGELRRNPRSTMSELGRRVGLSPPAVTERVQRLERSGIIAGYRLDIDPGALGMPLAAYVRIRPGPGMLPKAIEAARETPEVVECHRITGEDCLLVRVQVPTIEELEAVIDGFLLYGQTTSSIVQSSPVPPRPLPLP
ncbi:MAG: winged helix-turn-helix transcriptional regulator [Streptosporangiales bacterium]|nr:winged helix-turn-helix transcriptional regulator [Streptosporangiales bacterium]